MWGRDINSQHNKLRTEEVEHPRNPISMQLHSEQAMKIRRYRAAVRNTVDQINVTSQHNELRTEKVEDPRNQSHFDANTIAF